MHKTDELNELAEQVKAMAETRQRRNAHITRPNHITAVVAYCIALAEVQLPSCSLLQRCIHPVLVQESSNARSANSIANHNMESRKPRAMRLLAALAVVAYAVAGTDPQRARSPTALGTNGSAREQLLQCNRIVL